MGWLMYLLVELPVLRFYKQKSQSLPKLTLGSAMPIFALVLSGFIVLWIAFVNGVWERNPEAGKYLKIENEASLFRLNECFFVTKEDNLDESYNKCLDISTDTKNVLVTGDSLSANITSTFIDTFPNVNFLQASAVNYKPGLESSWTKSAKTLDRLVRSKLWERDVKIDLVVIFAMWQSSDLPMLVENVIALKEKGTKVLVIGPPVDYYTNVPLLQGMSELIDYDLVPHVRRKGRSEMDLEFRSELESVATYYVSVVDAFCQQNQCIHKNDNSGLYTDKVHLTRLGTEVLISDIRKHLNGFLN
ncbi:acyltransferase [Glaciecola sp. KUL10]|nr:acyltransferase [Glaciecola sp. KUL10]